VRRRESRTGGCKIQWFTTPFFVPLQVTEIKSFGIPYSSSHESGLLVRCYSGSHSEAPASMKEAVGASTSSPITPAPKVIRFGKFEVDVRAGELRRGGLKLKLGGQPFDVLIALLEKPGQVITREELHDKLWLQDTFVDFEHGLNKAINKLREALGDDADNPRFIETLPRRGYRFVAPVVDPSQPVGAVVTATTRDDQIAAPLPGSPVNYSAKPWRMMSLKAVTATIVVIAVLVLVASSTWRARSREQLKVLRFSQLTNDGLLKSGPMATDGVRIYFTETLPGQLRSIAQVSTTGGEVVRLPNPRSMPRVLDLSPDGSELLLGNPEDTGVGEDSTADSLWVQPVAGGSPRRVGSVLVNDAAWGAQPATVVYGDGDSVFSINQDGTGSHKLLSQPGSPYSFSFSPDGQMLRFSRHAGNRSSRSIMETSTHRTDVHELFPGCCGKWTADGRYFVFQSDQDGRTDLWAVPESGFPWKNAGSRPMQLTAGPIEFKAPVSSKNGKQIFAIGTLGRTEIVRYDLHTHHFVAYLPGTSAEGLSFSENGEWVAYTSYPDGILWRSRVDGSERIQLTFPPMRVLLPRWSPDGQQLLFSAHNPGRPWSVFILPSKGGTPKQVGSSPEDRVDANWSPDGNSLVFGSYNVPNNPIWIADMKTGQVSTLPGSVGLFSPRWSPDGRYICAIHAGRPFKLMLFAFATQKWTQLTNSDVGDPAWSRDSRYIYFQSGDPADWSETINRIRLVDRKQEKIMGLKDLSRSMGASSGVEWFGLAPDGSPLVATDISTNEIYALDVQWP
jgi:Tol biopolymer transport system component/DNA-binding winged helix-turn-helix (wHTH) protein